MCSRTGDRSLIIGIDIARQETQHGRAAAAIRHLHHVDVRVVLERSARNE
jgi:hypothetical protein